MGHFTMRYPSSIIVFCVLFCFSICESCGSAAKCVSFFKRHAVLEGHGQRPFLSAPSHIYTHTLAYNTTPEGPVRSQCQHLNGGYKVRIHCYGFWEKDAERPLSLTRYGDNEGGSSCPLPFVSLLNYGTGALCVFWQ